MEVKSEESRAIESIIMLREDQLVFPQYSYSKAAFEASSSSNGVPFSSRW